MPVLVRLIGLHTYDILHFGLQMVYTLRNTIVLLFILLGVSATSVQAQFWKKQTNSLLPDNEAFQVSAFVEGDQLKVAWQIADQYYMYRDQFSVISKTEGVSFGTPVYPTGVIENDPEFGEVEVYFGFIEYSVPIIDLPKGEGILSVDLKGQGCNKPVGVCYAPQTRPTEIAYTKIANSSSQASESLDQNQGSNKFAPTQKTSSSEEQKSIWGFVFASIVAGLLLSFTPCVLPMIPILAGVIARQEKLNRWRSGWLAICYVAGTIITYAIAGWIAGATGAQLQAYFQHPAVILFICALLLVLSLSLFGAFRIELPAGLQSKLNGQNPSGRSASFSTMLLGMISALVVGACVSPILIVTLGAAIQQGDPVLGAIIMASMALGMGTLLIAFGFGAGWLLPKTGLWMTQIQVVFAFMVIGVAIYLAGSIAYFPSLLAWAALLIWSGFYFGQLGKQVTQSVAKSAIKAISLLLLLWGAISLFGASLGGDDVLRPIPRTASLGTTDTKNSLPPFKLVTQQNEVETLLAEARSNNQPTLVDFYADWCLDCKRMDRTTYLEASVNKALTGWQLIKIDVTETNQNAKDVKRMFSVFGPPATLFINANGQELENLRQYGYLNDEELLALIRKTNP